MERSWSLPLIRAFVPMPGRQPSVRIPGDPEKAPGDLGQEYCLSEITLRSDQPFQRAVQIDICIVTPRSIHRIASIVSVPGKTFAYKSLSTNDRMDTCPLLSSHMSICADVLDVDHGSGDWNLSIELPFKEEIKLSPGGYPISF